MTLRERGLCRFACLCLSVIGALAVDTAVADTAIPAGVEGFQSQVKPFLNAHCVKCHGPNKSKGEITLHALNGDLAAGEDLARWETILEMLKLGEMPPEDEPQPDDATRKAVANWIESGLRENVRRTSQDAALPTARRLTNVEYENTLGDLIGFRLKVIDDPRHRPQAARRLLGAMGPLESRAARLLLEEVARHA